MRTIYLRITADKDGGFHVQAVDGVNRVQPYMQSRKLRSASEAKHEAARLFGLLQWRERADFTCELNFVVAMAAVFVEAAEGLK